MVFGDRGDFAIEAAIEPDRHTASTVWGHMCVWCRGVALGDLDERYCGLYPNSRVAIGDINDGTTTTLLVGERSRNLADATWSGVFGSRSEPGPLCTKRGRPVESCVGHMFLLMGRTGPSTDILSGNVPGGNSPNHRAGGADGFASQHPGGCNFLLCDGSVRFIKETVAPPVFQALATRAGGEIIGSD